MGETDWRKTESCSDGWRGPRWWSRRTCAHILLWELQNYNLLLNNRQQENVGSHQENYPTSKGKGEAPTDSTGGEIMFRIKPHTLQWCLEGSNKILCAPGEPAETEPDLLLNVWVSPAEVCVSSGLLQGQRLWVHQSWVWHKPFWRRSPLTPP